NLLTSIHSQGQTPPNLQPLRDIIPPTSPPPLPETPPSPIPKPEDLLSPPQPISPPSPSTEQTIIVTRFILTGNTVFSDRELKVYFPRNYSYQPIPLSRLLEITSQIAQRYAKAGYNTSGAVIVLPKETQDTGKGIVEIKVIEGEIEAIEVTPFESSRLNPNYIRSRLAVATGKPFNLNRLQEALQLLQLNPLIERVSAELSDGSDAGKSILRVQYSTAQTFHLEGNLDNNRAPSIGSFQRGVGFFEDNLVGLGDRLAFNYRNTDGSDEVETSYEIPWNPYNGTGKFRYRTINSRVIRDPFAQFDIRSDYSQYEFTLRQPVFQRPQREITFGLSLDRQESGNTVQGIGFPLSPSANLDGKTRITTLRFFQEWLERQPKSVISARSSFNFGINVLGTTEPFDASVNPFAPQSQYFMWRGQAQWVRALGANGIFLMRSDLQLSPDPLVALEQIAFGGFGTVRGYQQNSRLTDSGLIFTSEARLPLYRNPDNQIRLQLIPFIDYGIGWSVEESVPSPNTLASVGLGLLLQYRDTVTARIDWGIPLTNIDSTGNTLQEDGIYFSINFRPF
ncbi:MAG: ShlB/FhaC/HecB family hemolysin secretion/activation protein, partial [Microcystaceae cyanobacterium]